MLSEILANLDIQSSIFNLWTSQEKFGSDPRPATNILSYSMSKLNLLPSLFTMLWISTHVITMLARFLFCHRRVRGTSKSSKPPKVFSMFFWQTSWQTANWQFLLPWGFETIFTNINYEGSIWCQQDSTPCHMHVHWPWIYKTEHHHCKPSKYMRSLQNICTISEPNNPESNAKTTNPWRRLLQVR
jgi:hypothetical protein